MKVFLCLLGVFQSVVLGAAVRTTSTSGLDLIMRYEGFRSDFYLDQVGARTIGYGHACHGDGNNCGHIKPPLTKDAAISLLMSDLSTREACVSECLRTDLDQNGFSALVSLAFNVGCEAFKASRVLERLNFNDRPGAAKAMRDMASIGGQVLQDLIVRREAEIALFCSSGGC